MSIDIYKLRTPLYRIILPPLLLLLMGCPVRYVSDYDSSVKDEIVAVLKKVDAFYAELLDTDERERKYDKFKSRYIEIETDLRALLFKNEIRPLNKQSIKQSKTALELWVDDKKSHKENNTVSDFIIKQHRSQFIRLFTAMAKGEEAKNTSPQDEQK